MVELKFAILRRRFGQIALAVVLAEESIPFLSALVWNLLMPRDSNRLEGRTESLSPPSRRVQLMGATLEFITALVFVF